MNTHHTPGPWYIAPGLRASKAGPRHNVGPLAGGAVYTVADVGGNTREEREDNARLIAAAPDLLAACKLFTDAAHEAVRRFNDNGLPCPASIAYAAEQARRAIDKAEGK